MTGTTDSPQTTDSAQEQKEDIRFQRRLLIAEDNETTGAQLKAILELQGDFQVDIAHNGRDALEALTSHTYSVLLTDLEMPHVNGIQLIEELHKRDIQVGIIVLTGQGGVKEAVRALQMGASDFLTKPVNEGHLNKVLERLLRERSLQDEVLYLREALESRHSFQNVITRNPRMQAILELIQSIAHRPTTVLIEGETGTGKEQIARAIHQASSDIRSGKMVALNCAALPENLLESELFGHEKGAFTGAVGQRVGRFEQANGGTLFLDEVGEIPMSMQVKLLRVLQERKLERVGGTETIPVDVRIIAATNRSLERMVKRGKFREDLFYRINVVRIEIPPLRERTEDIPLLAMHFSQKFAARGDQPKKFSGEAMEILLNHPWRGNVRELENVVERACVTCPGDTIGPENLPMEMTRPGRAPSPFRIDLEKPLPDLLKEMTADIEERYIRKALQKTHGHVGKCAKLCGLSRRSVSAKIAEYGIQKEDMKE